MREMEPNMSGKKKSDWRDVLERISWDMNGAEIERESFRRIEAEVPDSLRKRFDEREWRVARRLIHSTADFAVAECLEFHGEPFDATLNALRSGAPIYCDSNMIKSGVSIPKLKRFHPSYEKESIMCHVADPDVAEAARAKGSTRALAAVEKAAPNLNGAIVLIGNAPLALAKIALMALEGTARPAMIIGMPVGFVNVEESKRLLTEVGGIPWVSLLGRRGGSPLAVATLHAILEESLEND